MYHCRINKQLCNIEQYSKKKEHKMDDHNFMHFSWSPKRNQIDEMIETDDIDELNDMIEEQVEGYEEVNILEENSDNDSTSYHYIDDSIIPENDTQGIYHLSNDDGIMNNSTRIGKINFKKIIK